MVPAVQLWLCGCKERGGSLLTGQENSQRCVCYFFEVSIVLLRVRIGRLDVKAGKCTIE